MPFQQGMNQQTPAVLNTIMRGAKKLRGAVKRRKKRSSKASASTRGSRTSGLRQYKVKSKKVRLPKFGSPAWRKRFKLDKK